MTLKIGEKVGEYKLARILPDRIAMESNGDMFEVLLYDAKNPKKRVEATTATKPGMIATPQPPPVSPSAEAPKSIPSQESVERLRGPVQTQVARPLPLNKHTYQLLGGSAATTGGSISYPTGGPSAQGSVRK